MGPPTADGLTGALNRRRFFEVADHEIERANRYGQKLSVAMIDLYDKTPVKTKGIVLPA